MTVAMNEQGRNHIVCDGDGCDANIIDLSPRPWEARRVAVTFFGWHAGPPDLCPRCKPTRDKRRRRSAAPVRWRYDRPQSVVAEQEKHA